MFKALDKIIKTMNTILDDVDVQIDELANDATEINHHLNELEIAKEKKKLADVKSEDLITAIFEIIKIKEKELELLENLLNKVEENKLEELEFLMNTGPPNAVDIALLKKLNSLITEYRLRHFSSPEEFISNLKEIGWLINDVDVKKVLLVYYKFWIRYIL